MSPAQLQQAQDMMKNMSPEQMETMRAMAANMGLPVPPAGTPMPSPADLNSARSTLTAQIKYKHDASMQLKSEGTALLKAGRYREAVEKYERGYKNLEGQTAAEVVELRTACTLNAAMCHLKLSDWAACASACTDVLAPGAFICRRMRVRDVSSEAQ